MYPTTLRTLFDITCYIKKKVKLAANEDRRDRHTAAGKDATRGTDSNTEDRIKKFQDQIQTTKYYRMPLKYICDIGLVNQPTRFNMQWCLTFETNMQRLFESKENLPAAVGLPNNVDTKIILDSAPYILYHQVELDDTFITYLEGAMILENNLQMGIKNTPLHKNYEMSVGSQSRTVIFNNSFKQFLSLRYYLSIKKAINIYTYKHIR